MADVLNYQVISELKQVTQVYVFRNNWSEFSQKYNLIFTFI